MSIREWFRKRAAPCPSPLIPLADRVQKQAQDLRDAAKALNRMITDQEGHRHDPRHP